jgi:hypothetical protein
MGKGGISSKSARSKVNRDIDKLDDEAEIIEIKRDLSFDDVTVCCALCCLHCGIYTNWDW